MYLFWLGDDDDEELIQMRDCAKRIDWLKGAMKVWAKINARRAPAVEYQDDDDDKNDEPITQVGIKLTINQRRVIVWLIQNFLLS